METTTSNYMGDAADLANVRNDCHACNGTGSDATFGGKCSECAHDNKRDEMLKALYAGVRTGRSDREHTPGERLDGRTFGTSAPRQSSAARANKFPGSCTLCKSTVEAGAGTLERKDGKWLTTHADGECVASTPDTARKSTQEHTASTQLDLSSLPSGTYAVPGGDTRLKIQVDNVLKGKWAGWVFVKDGAEYGNSKRYGRQAPGGKYSGDVEDALVAILADPQAAMAAYGKLVGRCGMCSRKLEDADSIARGIGPVCAQKF
jgi:hypothetical protein